MCFLYDSKHEKPLARLFFRIINFIYIIIALAMIVVGIIIMTKLPKGKTLPIVVVIIGAAIILAAILGFLGSRSTSPNAYICLEIYYLISLAGAVLLIILGISFFVGTDSFEATIISNYDDLMEDVDDADSLKKDLKDVVKNTAIIGAVVLTAAILLTLGFLFCCYLMGLELFLRSTIRMGSLVLIVLGLFTIIVALVAYILANETIRKEAVLLIAFLAVGGVTIIIGIFGFSSMTCCRSSRCVLDFVIVFFVILAIGYIILGVIAIASADKTYDNSKDALKKKCAVSGADQTLKDSECSDLVESVLTYLCDQKLAEDSTKTADKCEPVAGDPASCKCWPLDKLPARTWAQFAEPVTDELAQLAEGSYYLMGVIGLGGGLFLVFMSVITIIYCCYPSCAIQSKRHSEHDLVQVSVNA